MHFKDFLQISADEINQEIETFFNNWSKEVDRISPRLFPYAHALSEVCRGGKRIRGALIKLGYSLSLPTKNTKYTDREILKIAVAYEIFQAAILAHDDIIDKSLTRRKEPSLYVRLGGNHSGISKAICLGDIGFFLAFNLIAASSFPDKFKNNALEIFSRSMLDTGMGELLDVELSQKNVQDSTIQDIITIYKFKTAHYTITSPLLLGSVLSGREIQDLQPIRDFGQNLGIAFQIQDDINDIFSDKKKLGKELGGDIKEGKMTLLFAYAAENASPRDKSSLKKYYGNDKIGNEEIEIIKKVLTDSGAFDYALKEARDYSQKAKACVSKITKDESLKILFEEMTEFFVAKV